MTEKTSKRRFDLFAFDWDGTLFDSTGLIVRCIQAACRDIGMPEPSDVQAAYVIGLGLMDALRHAVPDLPVARYPELGRRYRHHYTARQHEIVLFEGTREMLAALKARNHWLAVATGKSRLGLNEALDAAQLRTYFDSTRTADETASKPHPLMLQELMGELGAEPARTLMIGDTTHDLQLAVNAGVACVGVSYGAHPSEDFHRFAPLFVAHSTRELHDWLHDHA
jgi:phosphoglycolate phosphatase